MIVPRVAATLLLALACLPLSASAANAAPTAADAQPLRGFPRLALYGSIRGNGYPFYNAPIDSALVDSVLDQVSRYEEITLDVNPIFPYRPDIIAGIKQRNPSAKVLGYVVGQDIWNAQDRDSLRHYPTRYRRLLDNNNGWLFSKLTGQKYYAGNVNLAKRDASGRLVIADSLALLWKENLIDPGIWDGVFFDILCDEMGWPQAEGDSIDFVRAGYSSFEAFNASWRAATDSIATKLRNWGGPDFIMVGNCALGTKYSTFNGWMREGFPFQAGGDWYSNMFQQPGGYITDEVSFLEPRSNYIFSFQVGSDHYSSTNNRILRFGLGSASLANGFGVFAVQNRDAFTGDYHEWWYDEYAVDLETGRSSQSMEHTGWLGQALTPFYQMIWAGQNPEGILNSGFETSVTDGWGFYAGTPATRSLDVSTFAVGGASARIDIQQASPIDWNVALQSNIAIPIVPWTNFSATFWMKASTPRTISVVISRTNAQQLLWRQLQIGTEWKQYQIPFLSYSTLEPPNSTRIAFYLGKDTGSVWLDDVHFQSGLSTVYRRDFQNGIVLVNPSFQSGADVVLPRPFRRILGSGDPFTNDGSTGMVQYVGPADALFLIGDDMYPPSRVTDLRQAPTGN